MAINVNVRQMIDALARNDLPRARACARVIIANDTAQSNAVWRKRALRELDAIEKPGAEGEYELPSNVRQLLVLERPGERFIPERYVPTDRELQVLSEIEAMHKVSPRLAQLQIRHLNSTLLYGESGTGKTTFARYVSCRLDLPLVYLDLSRVIDSYLGSTSKNISNIFDFVRSFPCVFLVDELDAIATARSAGHGGAEKEIGRVTIALIQELDRLSSMTVMLAATNRPDIIDPAITRRFTRAYELVRVRSRVQVKCMVDAFMKSVGMVVAEGDYVQWAKGEVKRLPRQADVDKAVSEAVVAHLMEDDGTNVVPGVYERLSAMEVCS